jgi:beta-galactosidase
VISKYFPVPDELPERRPQAVVSTATVHESVPVLDVLPALGTALELPGPAPTTEDAAHYRGFTLYSTVLERGGMLTVGEVRDRAQFFLAGAPVGVLSRDLGERAIALPSGGLLQVLVEDQGRVNYGQRIGEVKGLIAPVKLDGEELLGWEIRPLDFAALQELRGAASRLTAGRGGVAGPSVSFADFDADGPEDRYLRLDGWTKGNPFINGFNLGRYWSRGPQRTLYIPAPLIRTGRNELAILELHGSVTREVRFVDGPDLGPDEK